jgi:hypothetical protein
VASWLALISRAGSGAIVRLSCRRRGRLRDWPTTVIPTSRALWDSEPASAARARTTVLPARTTETEMAGLHPYPGPPVSRLLATEKTPDAVHKTAPRFGRSRLVPVPFWSVTKCGAVDLAGPSADPWRIGGNRLRLAGVTFMLWHRASMRPIHPSSIKRPVSLRRLPHRPPEGRCPPSMVKGEPACNCDLSKRDGPFRTLTGRRARSQSAVSAR